MSKEMVDNIKKIVSGRIEVEQKTIEEIQNFNQKIEQLNQLLEDSKSNKTILLSVDSDYMDSIINEMDSSNSDLYRRILKQARYLEENAELMSNTTQYATSKRFLDKLYLELRKYYLDMSLVLFKKRRLGQESVSKIWSAQELLSSIGDNGYVSLINDIDNFNEIIDYSGIDGNDKLDILEYTFFEQLEFFKKYKVKKQTIVVPKKETEYQLDNPEFVGPILPYDEPKFEDLEIEEINNTKYLTEEQFVLLNSIANFINENTSDLDNNVLIANRIKSVKDIIVENEQNASNIVKVSKEIFGINCYLKDMFLYQIKDCYNWINECLEEISNCSPLEKEEFIDAINKAFEDYEIYLKEYKDLDKVVEKEKTNIKENSDNRNNLIFLPTNLNGKNICFESDMKEISKNRGLYPHVIKLLDDLKDGNFHLNDSTKGVSLGTEDINLKGFYEIKFKKTGELPAFRIIYQKASNNNIIVYGVFLRKDDPANCIKNRQANGVVAETLRCYKDALKNNSEMSEKIINGSYIAEERIYDKLRENEHSESRRR